VRHHHRVTREHSLQTDHSFKPLTNDAYCKPNRLFVYASILAFFITPDTFDVVSATPHAAGVIAVLSKFVASLLLTLLASICVAGGPQHVTRA
jgi:hypothetical protein